MERNVEEERKLITDLRNVNKTNVLIPLFYTVIFVLVTLSAIILTQESWVGRLVFSLFSGVIAALNWGLFYRDKKKTKELNVVLDEMETNIYYEKNEDDYLTDEEVNLLQEKAKLSLASYTKLIITSTIFSIFILFLDEIPLESSINTTVAVLLGIILLFYLVSTIVNGMILRKYISKVTEE